MVDSGTVEMSIDRELRDKAFNHLQTLSFSYFNRNSVGYIHARVMSDTPVDAHLHCSGIHHCPVIYDRLKSQDQKINDDEQRHAFERLPGDKVIQRIASEQRI